MSRTITIINRSRSKLLNRWFLPSPSISPAIHRTTRSLETVSYEEVRSSSDKPYTSTAFVLHGLLGSGRNWRSFSRRLASSLSDKWRMVLVDLRNHGNSAEIEGLLPPHEIGSAAQDLADLVKLRGWDWPDVVIGHSMGGKVALHFARSCARGDYGPHVRLPRQPGFLGMPFGFLHLNESLMRCKKAEDDVPIDTCKKEQLWILDSVPVKVNSEDSNGEVEKVLETLQTIPSTIPSRKWLVDHMMKLGFSKALSEWIGSNLKRSGDQVTWAFNLEGAVQMFNSYRETDYGELLERPPKGMEIAIVRAENSDRWTPELIQEIQRLAARSSDEGDGKVVHYVLPKSGHWVHVDNPKGLLEILTPKMASL